MGAAFRNLDRFISADDIASYRSTIAAADGKKAEDIVDELHPVVADRLLWEEYEEQNYTDSRLSVSSERYADTLEALKTLQGRASKYEEPDENTLLTDPFTRGWNRFYNDVHETGSIQDVYDDNPPFRQGLNTGRLMISVKGLGAGACVYAANQGETVPAAGILVGGMGLGVMLARRRNEYWEGFNAGYGHEQAKLGAAKVAYDIGDRRLDVMAPEHLEPDTVSLDASDVDRGDIEDVLRFIDQHEGLTDEQREKYEKYLE